MFVMAVGQPFLPLIDLSSEDISELIVAELPRGASRDEILKKCVPLQGWESRPLAYRYMWSQNRILIWMGFNP